MKAIFTTLLFLCITTVTFSQKILFVNDNDLNSANTDTMRAAMNNSSFSNYTYWSVPDSTTALTAAYLKTFDLVIWYCSTDGVGLNIWDGSTTGNAEVVDYIKTGKPIWIIGLDILYQQYIAGPTTFVTGDFAYDQMGLLSYDGQSFANDGSLGVSNVYKLAGVPANFPDTIRWTFSTLWYVDACTPLANTKSMYAMGGDGTYPLLGAKCMFHNKTTDANVMTTFFDPALMDASNNRIPFVDTCIDYLLKTVPTKVANQFSNKSIALVPNPATNIVYLIIPTTTTSQINYQITNVSGKMIKQENVKHTMPSGNLPIDVSAIPAGLYFINVKAGENYYHQQFVKK